jgi:hypothetical protein
VLNVTSSTPLDLGCGTLSAAAGGSTLVAHLDGAGACVFGASFAAPNLSIDVDPGGRVVVHGLASGAVDLGGGPLAPIGTQDFVLGVLDAAGNHVWSRRFGAAGVTFSSAPTVALPAAGNLYLLAQYSGAVSFGGTPVTAAAGDLVVASFTGAGAPRWSRALSIQGQYSTSVDGCGALVVASVDPAFDPGCGLLISDNNDMANLPGPLPSIGVARFQP